MAEIRDQVFGIAMLIGFPEYDEGKIYNSCAVLLDGHVVSHYRKQLLPNYSVFDEERYFKAGKEPAVFKINGVRIGMTICEDIWQPAPMARSRSAGAECIIAINGSPYELGAQGRREKTVAARISEIGVPVLYVNMVGGQDELVFDGGSFAMDAERQVRFRAPPFDEGLHTVPLLATASGVVPQTGSCTEPLPTEDSVYRALVTGTRDYVTKHGFPGVVIGLSGGIDSALVTAIACDAIGADRVRAVMMPFRYTSTMSQEDAAEQAATLNVGYDVIPIEPIYDAIIGQLQPVLGDRDEDVTEENIQARCRGLLLMAHLEQDRPHAADDRQQERNGGRLRHAVRRHGRRLCADQGLQQDAGVSPGALSKYAWQGDSGARHYAAAVRRTAAGSERQRFAAGL